MHRPTSHKTTASACTEGLTSLEQLFKVIEEIFQKFEDKDGVSLIMTKDVLANREKLEVTLQGLQRQMDECLGEMEVLRQEEMILKKYEAEITANKNFTYKIKVPYIYRHGSS